jgi:hypothetical protein
MAHSDLFEFASGKNSNAPKGESDPIGLAAHRLAVQLTENDLLPTRYRRNASSAQRKRKRKQESEIEQRFKASVRSWQRLIETMLSKLDSDLAWRFINVSPRIDEGHSKLTDSPDFCAFIDYLILRRDNERCDPDELGDLAMLSVAFQRQIEKRLPQREEPGQTEPSVGADSR